MTRNKTVTLASIIQRSEGILVSEIDHEVVMMSVETGTYAGLDAIGSEIWRLLESPCRVSEICDRLVERYEVERDRCEGDVLAFLNELASDGTIRILPTPA